MQVIYTPPQYTCDAGPRLPQELIDHIIGLLQNDVLTLANCSLTCRAFHHESRYHLWARRGRIISNRQTLDFVSRVLSSQRTRLFYQHESLIVVDDARLPFAHTFPLCVAGHHLSRMRLLNFSNADWKKGLHPSFFISLSDFKSVTDLFLERCLLSSINELRRVITALPNLRLLLLGATDIDRPTRSLLRYPETHLPPLRHVWLRSMTSRQSVQLLIDMLSSFFTVDELTIENVLLRSFLQLQQFLKCFSRLKTLSLRDSQWSCNRWPDETVALPGTDLHPSCTSLSRLVLWGLSSAQVRDIVQWLMITPSCGTLEDLSIENANLDITTVDMQHAVCALLHSLGTVLKRLRWRWDATFVPPIACASNLDKLSLGMPIHAESPAGAIQRVCECVARVLSQGVPRTRTGRLDLDFFIKLRLGVCDANLAVTRYSIPSTFDAVVCGDTRSLLPRNGIWIRIFCDSPGFSCAARAILLPLFAPWLSRGALRVTLPDFSQLPDLIPVTPWNDKGPEGISLTQQDVTPLSPDSEDSLLNQLEAFPTLETLTVAPRPLLNTRHTRRTKISPPKPGPCLRPVPVHRVYSQGASTLPSARRPWLDSYHIPPNRLP